MQSEIKQWGNSAAVRLSRTILAQAGLDVASPVEIEVMEGRIVIKAATTPVKTLKLPFSEEDILRGMTAYTAHADELADVTGTEIDY